MVKKSRTEYSFLNIVTGLGGYTVNTILGFVCRMVFVRYLSDAYLGINGLLANFLSMLSLAELGIGSAIIYALYKPIAQNDEDKIASLMRIYKTAYFIIGTIVGIAGVIAMPFLEFIVSDTSVIRENIRLIYGIFLFNTASGYFFSYKCSLICAYQKDYVVTGISYIITSLQSIVQMAALAYFQSYLPYLIIQTVGTQSYNLIITLIANKHYSFINKKNPKRLPKNEIQALWKNVKSVTVYKLSGTLVNNTDNLVITYFSGLGISGLASNYTLLINTLNTLITQIFSALTASIGNLNAQSEIDRQFEFFGMLNLANFWMYSWAALGATFVSGDLVALCFGTDYILDWKIPLMLSINLYMVGMQNAVWTFKNTKGMFKYGQYILLFTAFLNVLGDIYLGQRWGVFGIFLATAIARLLTNTWYEPFALFKYGFKKSPFLYLVKYTLYAFILCGEMMICHFVCFFISFTPLINIIVKGLFCSLLSNAIFVFCFHNSKEYQYFKEIIERVIHILKAIPTKLKEKIFR